MKLLIASMALASLLVACVDTTGGDLVTFPAVAAGPSDAVEGQPLDFVNDRGWHVSLTTASLHVGAVYLNQSTPVSGAQNTSCILPGTYVAQVTTGIDVDLLSPAQQSFPRPGSGVAIPALAGQLWLTGGDIDTVADATPILHVSGTADQNSAVLAFEGTLTIGANRVAQGASGGNPICKQRIVSPIPTAVEPRAGGRLLLQIDPRLLFVNVDFTAPASGMYVIPDDSSDQPSRNLYQNLHSSAPYRFEWAP
jgi:hypothetical protein